MAQCGFIFDIIVVRIDAPSVQFDNPDLLTVDANFNNISLKITSSRINVFEFRSGRSYEFEANAEELRADLEEHPLRLSVSYNNEEVGVGYMPWPANVLDKMTDSLGELTHVDECELTRDNEQVGMLEVIVRLQCKCQEMGEGGVLMKGGDDIRKHLDKVINPHDILFVVGDNEKEDECEGALPGPSTTCQGPEQNPTALDLSPYRSINGQLVQTPDILNTCMNDNCCELKKMTNKYQELIQTLVSCGNREEPKRKCGASSHTRDCPHDNKFSSPSSTRDSSDIKFPCVCYATQHAEDGAFAGEKLINICPVEPEPPLIQQVHNTTRRCAVCKENISWLPKLAACPKCGYKPVPYVEEKPYNEQLTADQILQQYLDKPSSRTEQHSGSQGRNGSEPKKECCCTCKNGKICAHCRIRKLCADIFQPDGTNAANQQAEDCGKCEAQLSEMYNVCNTSSVDCRPYLERVFSELRDLYDIKETKPKSFDLNARCERELHKSDGKKKKSIKQLQQQDMRTRNPQKKQSKKGPADRGPNAAGVYKKKKKVDKKSEEIDRNMYTMNNFKSSTNVCKSKTFNFNEERVYPGVQIGHKTCINGFAGGRKNVPRNMGWLWNATAPGARRGWKPGAIRKPIKEMMKYFLKDYPADTLRVSQYSYRNQCKNDGTEEVELVQKPTLHICKKNDEYFITLRPLKDPEALRQCADPYLNMKPIQFKITKNPHVAEMRKLKRCLKEMGFSKCTCHKPIIECFCRSFLDKKKLEYQANKECRKRNIPCCNDSLVLSDTTDSDVEFDFGVTPPAGVIKPERLKKPNLVNHGTQYMEGDWNIPPLFPKPPNKYMKLYNCATGGRYGPDGAKAPPGGWGAGIGGGGAGGKDGKGGRLGGGGKFGGKVGKGGPGAVGGTGGIGGPNGKVDMMKYLKNMEGKGGKGGAGGEADKRKQRLRALGEIPPPLLCMIDRRGKPIDPCLCCPNPCCEDVCACVRRNTRIC